MNTRTSNSAAGFTLVEMIVVTLLLLIAMVGPARRVRRERAHQQERDRRGRRPGRRAVRHLPDDARRPDGRLRRPLRHPGGPEQVRPSASMTGITPSRDSYDNVTESRSPIRQGNVIPVRNGTDMIEVRGVIFSPLVAFDQQTGCSNDCTSSGGPETITVMPIIGGPARSASTSTTTRRTGRSSRRSIAYTATASATRARCSWSCRPRTGPAPGLRRGLPDARSRRHRRAAVPAAVLQRRRPADLTRPSSSGRAPRPGLPDTVDFGTDDRRGVQRRAALGRTVTPPDADPEPRGGSACSTTSSSSSGFDPTLGPGGHAPVPGAGDPPRRPPSRSRVLADDVEDLQVAYGVDLDTAPNHAVEERGGRLRRSRPTTRI